MERLFVKIKTEVLNHRKTYFLLLIIILLSFFVRVYRTRDLLGFYYDQGRDALVVWRLWHDGKLFLVGPVTGLAGIFLGPFYYYLIAPIYLVGGGDPVFPAVFLASLATIATLFLFVLGQEFHSREAGIIAAIIGGFSYYIVLAGRWLSNPTPILLTSLLFFYSLWKIIKRGSKNWWIAVAILVGISLHFEAASAVFYLPVVAVFYLWQALSVGGRKNLPGAKVLLVAAGAFLLTLFPQIAFNFRHDNLLLNNFKRVFLEEKSFRLSFWEVLDVRLKYFWSVFSSKLFAGWPGYSVVFSLFSFGALFLAREKFIKTKLLPLFIIFLGVPMIGYIAFQGNYGNIYDYYMTGYYLPMILLFSIGLAEVWRIKAGKFVVLAFFLFFLSLNGMLLKNYLTAGTDGPTHITLGNQLQAVDYVFKDAEGRGDFNVDVYVPPVIPYAYDYLFLWQGTKRCGKDLCGMKLDERVPLLYTLYEVDPPHPERLEKWLEIQAGIGLVQEEARFGGITVQRRTRF